MTEATTVTVRFWLRLPIFVGGPEVYVLCWLRVRVVDGALSIWYRMHRAHEAIDAAWESIVAGVEKCAEEAGCDPVYRACPQRVAR